MNKSKSNRAAILEKSDGQCWYCGCDLGNRWQADHFHPVIRWGGKPLYPELDTFENLVPSCAPCNNFKTSNSIEGFRRSISDQFKNTLSTSTGLRQLNRLGLIDIELKPVQFWFEKQGHSLPDEMYFYGISDKAKHTTWTHDKSDACHIADIGRFIVSVRKNPTGVTGLLVIATAPDWEQYRTEIAGCRFEKERAAEWAIRIDAQ